MSLRKDYAKGVLKHIHGDTLRGVKLLYKRQKHRFVDLQTPKSQ